jgi:hypothetical protein
MLEEGGVGGRGRDGGGEWRRWSDRRWWLGVAVPAVDYKKSLRWLWSNALSGEKNRRKEIKN